MSGHTPGPWKVASAAACAEIEVFEIAEVSHFRVIPAAGGWPTAGTPEADARLIAAAPDLLLALVWLHSLSTVEGTKRGDLREQLQLAMGSARAAIASATGEQAS